MGILSWIIFGLIAGILAKWIMPGKDGGGFFMTIILGIVGAVVGGWISTFFWLWQSGWFQLRQLCSRGDRRDCRAVNLQKNQKLNAELSEIIKATTGSLYYSK